MKFIDGAPIPPRKFRSTPGATYGLSDLAVGQSVQHLVADMPEDGRLKSRVTLMSRVTSAAAYVRKKTGCTFTTRYIDGGVQVWRVS
jgi:hypothetical protein